MWWFSNLCFFTSFLWLWWKLPQWGWRFTTFQGSSWYRNLFWTCEYVEYCTVHYFHPNTFSKATHEDLQINLTTLWTSWRKFQTTFFSLRSFFNPITMNIWTSHRIMSNQLTQRSFRQHYNFNEFVLFLKLTEIITTDDRWTSFC